MFLNCYRIGLTTLVVFALALPVAFSQVVKMPTISDGWGAMAAALDPVTDDILVVGAGFEMPGYFNASSVSFNGSVNTGFGGGIVQTSVSSEGMNWPNACAVDYEGRLLSAGSSAGKSGGIFTTVRYNANGSLDTTFGSKGIVTTQFKGLDEAAIYAMTMQGSGSSEKIVVAGNNGELNPVLLARYTESGALDTTFGAGGTVSTITPFESLTVEDVALQSSGDIIVCAAVEESNGVEAMALMRYTANGQLDKTFGSNGYVTLTIDGPDGDDTFPYGIAVDDENNIVVAGCNEDSGVLALARFTANGALDGTFGNAGIVTESFACQAQAVAIDDRGNIVVSGLAANGENLLVARFTSDGDLDNTFGSSKGVFNGQGYADDFVYSPCAHSGATAALVVRSAGLQGPIGWLERVGQELRERGGAVQLQRHAGHEFLTIFGGPCVSLTFPLMELEEDGRRPILQRNLPHLQKGSVSCVSSLGLAVRATGAIEGAVKPPARRWEGRLPRLCGDSFRIGACGLSRWKTGDCCRPSLPPRPCRHRPRWRSAARQLP